MNTRTKIKVNRVKLIEALTARIDVLNQERVEVAKRLEKDAKAEAERRSRQYREEAKKLLKAADDLDKGKDSYVPWELAQIRSNPEGAHVRDLKRAIATLELSDEDEIAISQADYASYL